jgi:ribosomal-protein-alanine N-acetyltransferase
MPNIITTTNLALRQFTTDDASFIFQLLNTPGWKKFIGDRFINTLDDATNYILTGPIASYAKNGYGGWMVTLKETGEPIGMCGLFKRDYLAGPDLGFAFLPQFEGKGFGYESSMAAIQHIKHNYALDGLYATTALHNIRSQRLLARCGFTDKGTVTLPGYTDDSALFYLSL